MRNDRTSPRQIFVLFRHYQLWVGRRFLPHLKVIYVLWQTSHSKAAFTALFSIISKRNEIKWNELGFRPPLCTYRLNWARRPSWGWWDDWDDTVLQTQDSKFEPWWSDAEHATSRSRRLPTILTFTRGWGRNIFVSFKPPKPGTEPRTLAWKAAVLTTTLGPPPPNIQERNVNPPQVQCSMLDQRHRCWPSIEPALVRCGDSGDSQTTILLLLAQQDPVTANRRHSTDVSLMLGQRRRRWPSIKLTLVQCLLFAGI